MCCFAKTLMNFGVVDLVLGKFYSYIRARYQLIAINSRNPAYFAAYPFGFFREAIVHVERVRPKDLLSHS